MDCARRRTRRVHDRGHRRRRLGWTATPARSLGPSPCLPAVAVGHHGPMPSDERPAPGNDDLARIFHEIGDLLEVRGELVFKVQA